MVRNVILIFFMAMGGILAMAGILTVLQFVPGQLSYDAANIVGAVIFCSGILIGLISFKGMR